MTAARVSATFSRPADNTAYAVGDSISNSTTGSAVLPLTFNMPRGSGRITGCSAVVTPASGNLVITALDFHLLLFRPLTSIPFAAGSFVADNSAMAITAASFREMVGKFVFSSSSWQNPAGGVTAGVTGYQSVVPSVRSLFMYNASATDAPLPSTLIGVVQALGAWTPTGVINQFDFALDLDVDGGF